MDDLKLIKVIKKEISNSLSRNSSLNFEETAKLFVDFMRLPITEPNVELDGCSRIINAIHKLLDDTPEKDDRDTFLAELTKVEPFLRKILLYVNKPEYLKIVANKDGFISLINALNLNPNKVNLDQSPKGFDESFIYIDHFIKVYKIRNIESHNIKEYSTKETGEFIESALMIYIYVCNKYRHKILEAITAYSEIPLPEFNNYCDLIIESFKERIGRIIHLQSKENVTLSSTYVSEFVLKSIEDREISVREGTIDELRKNQVQENRMLLWGEAGMGKTTTLEFLTYKDALEYKKNNSCSIPVLIPLGFLTDMNVSLKQYVFSKLEIESKVGEILFEKGKLNLFFDGLNEIPLDEKNQLRTMRYKEIETLINANKKLFIIISNRPHDINIFNNVPVFIIQKMNDRQIEDFINKYTESQKNLGVLLKEKLKDDDRLKEIVRTPLMLSRLIEILKSEGVIPENEGKIIDKFIKSIYKRERIEKKDANFNEDVIHRLLLYLSSFCLEVKGTNSGLTKNEVYAQFQKCITNFGFKMDLAYAIDIIVQLNILEIREGLYSFSHQSYLDYFYAEYERMVFEL
ncbi:MAG: NACHT domain-containing protein [Bacteroidota bacterium]|nr:NACHT domain-containing protein [Bacteroidota bacterium]